MADSNKRQERCRFQTGKNVGYTTLKSKSFLPSKSLIAKSKSFLPSKVEIVFTVVKSFLP